MIFNASFNMLFGFNLEKYITYATFNLRLPYYYFSDKNLKKVQGIASTDIIFITSW